MQTYGVSQEFSFVTPPTPGTDEPVTFFAIADLGGLSLPYPALAMALGSNQTTHLLVLGTVPRHG